MNNTQKEQIIIDGSFGEGGGQILRSSLSLSLITGRPLHLKNIRAGRAKPGLMRQHLTAVRAAAEIGGAETVGDELKSTELEFTPGPIKAGEYHFPIGTSGSTTLVLQTVLPPLFFADGPSKVRIEGGTHNMKAPPFDFIEKAFMPLLEQMGVQVNAKLLRHGFHPAGGGILEIEIFPAKDTQALHLNQKGEIKEKRVRVLNAKLPGHISDREMETLRNKLNWPAENIRRVEINDSLGSGNIVLVEIETSTHTEVYSGFAQKGKKAEQVAGGAAEQALAYLKSPAVVGEYLADQLLLPMAIFAGGSYTTNIFSEHTRTNIEVIKRFMDGVTIESEKLQKGVWEVRVEKDA